MNDRITIELNTYRVYRGSQLLQLTELEFQLLNLLASKPGHIFSRDELLQRLWGYDGRIIPDTKTVDVHISRLRVKLHDNALDPLFITTIRGRGYMYIGQR